MSKLIQAIATKPGITGLLLRASIPLTWLLLVFLLSALSPAASAVGLGLSVIVLPIMLIALAPSSWDPKARDFFTD
jgi:hypothetical protein